MAVCVVVPLAATNLRAAATMAPSSVQLSTPAASPAGVYADVPYVRYDGIFEGETSTGAFRVPYRITAPANPEASNRTVLVEPSHFVLGLGVLSTYLRPGLLFGDGFAHAGIGWSTASFGPGLRILDPAVPGVFIDGGIAEGGGRTDIEIIAAFARALTTDPQARAMLGKVSLRYAVGFSDSSYPLMDLVSSGRADGVFDLALPMTTEGPDPQPVLADGLFGGKLMIVNSEFDDFSTLLDRQVAPDAYRFYAVAGTPHVPDHLDIPSAATRSTPASWEPALRAHFRQADRWVKRGTPPTASYQFATSAGQIARDPNGNAITVDPAGHRMPRLPFLELGEAHYLTGFMGGGYDSVKTITQLGFATHEQYLKAFKSRVSDYRAAGYIHPQEADAMNDRADLCPPLTYTETYRDHYDNFVAITPC
jgi:hypothetical protein